MMRSKRHRRLCELRNVDQQVAFIEGLNGGPWASFIGGRSVCANAAEAAVLDLVRQIDAGATMADDNSAAKRGRHAEDQTALSQVAERTKR